MKKIVIIYIGLFTAALMSSCDSLLEVEAENAISGDIYSNTEQIQEALTGAYFNLGGIADENDGGELLGGDFSLMSILLGRQNTVEVAWVNELNYENFIDKDILPTNSVIARNWRRAYETINQVNNILANISNVENDQQGNRIQGEALAIRGILYFEMVRLWAPQFQTSTANNEAIPLILTPINDLNDLENITSATIGQIYDQAENDLIAAAQLLSSFGKNGTNLSEAACFAYLARLAMQKSEFGNAVTYSSNVINTNLFQLETDFRDAFNNPVNSSEDIFAIQQNFANNTGDISNGNGITVHFSSLSESGFGTLSLITSYLTTTSLTNAPRYYMPDARMTLDTSTDDQTKSSEVNTMFYQNGINTLLISSAKYTQTNNVFPVIRLAEMYLIRSEALFELNFNAINTTALNDLNTIRERAGINRLNVTDFSNPDEFYDSLVVEKNRELFLEGHLLHDLKRRRANLESSEIVVGFSKNPLDSELILPIPQSETDASGID